MGPTLKKKSKSRSKSAPKVSTTEEQSEPSPCTSGIDPMKGTIAGVYMVLGDIRSAVKSLDGKITSLEARICEINDMVSRSERLQKLDDIEAKVDRLYDYARFDREVNVAEGPVQFLAERYNVEIEPKPVPKVGTKKGEFVETDSSDAAEALTDITEVSESSLSSVDSFGKP